MIRFFAKRRHRKGFTLTELIVVTALIAILMAAVAGFSGPVRSVIRNTYARSDATTINKVIGDYVQNRLAYANYIDIYVGTPPTYGSSEYGDMKKSFEDIEALADDAKNNPRVMVFRFLDDTTTDNKISDKYNYTFRVYDHAVSDGDTMPANVYTSFCTSDDAVFLDQFYSKYQYFFTMDDMDVSANQVKNRAYIKFTLDSYYCRGEEDGGSSATGLTQANIKAYHQYVDSLTNPSVTPLENPMNQYLGDKTGTENISFALENIKLNNEGKPTKARVRRGQYSSSASPIPYGTDIFVFYNVRTYEHSF